jgi:hypothetical protein
MISNKTRDGCKLSREEGKQMRLNANPILILTCALFLYNPARADRFVNTGAGFINTCDSVTHVGIGVVSPYDSRMDGQSNVVLGPNDFYYNGITGSRLQLSTPPNDSGVAVFLDNYLEGGLYPCLRFLGGSNSSSWYRLASLSLKTGDFWVNGGLSASSITITGPYNPPDYVFEPDYKLRSLAETERFVRAHKHLPDVPSANEMQNGMDLSDLNLRLLKQVEELTLRAIDQEKRIKKLEKDLLKRGEKQ